MNWAAGLYGAGLWLLAASIWSISRPPFRPRTELGLIARILIDVAPGLLLGLLIARYI